MRRLSFLPALVVVGSLGLTALALAGPSKTTSCIRTSSAGSTNRSRRSRAA